MVTLPFATSDVGRTCRRDAPKLCLSDVVDDRRIADLLGVKCAVFVGSRSRATSASRSLCLSPLSYG